LDRQTEIVVKQRQGKLVFFDDDSCLSFKIHSGLSSIQTTWRKLEADGQCSFYQTYDWCSSFFETFGPSKKLDLCIVEACDARGEIAFVLPFQIRKKYGLRILEWLAQAENNYGQGLFSVDFSGGKASKWFDQNLASVFKALPPFDVINLQNTPLSALGYPDIFANVPKSKAANSSYVTLLKPPYENLLRSKRSAKSISKIRRRDERIMALGDVQFCVEPLGSRTSAALAECFIHKKKQLAEMGITNVFEDQQQKFLLRLTYGESLRAFKLTCDGQTISTIIGATYGNRFWLMITSLSANAPLALSPGDLLLRKTIAWCCEQNLELFDFSNGEIGYKTIWADEKVQLYNYFASQNMRSLPFAALLKLYHATKRQIKSSEQLRSLFNLVRTKFKGRA
jgi:CelD/BcsL family acetyltransferase involved in cellulose biosynthesis